MLHLRRFVPVALALVTACGASSNVFGILTPAADKHSFASELALAQAAYDRGDLQGALGYARNAYDLDPGSERATLLYGFINLSLAGGDPFVLAKGLIAAGKNPAGGAGTSTGTLAALRPVIGLTSAELALMGQVDATDPSLPVIIPACAESVRIAVAKLAYVNAAIAAVCPFVDGGARIPDDPLQQCAAAPGSPEQAPRALFLWAFAHLTEAMAFNAVLTYATADPTGAESNLERRALKLQTLNTAAPTTGVAALASALSGFDATLSAVLPASGVCAPGGPTTQLRATLNDMLAVAASFQLIPGIPAGVANAVVQEMARIRGAAAPGAAGGSAAQLQALKGNFSRVIAAKLAAKLDALGATPSQPVSAAEKAQLCGAFASIAAGTTQASKLCPSPP